MVYACVTTCPWSMVGHDEMWRVEPVIDSRRFLDSPRLQLLSRFNKTTYISKKANTGTIAGTSAHFTDCHRLLISVSESETLLRQEAAVPDPPAFNHRSTEGTSPARDLSVRPGRTSHCVTMCMSFREAQGLKPNHRPPFRLRQRSRSKCSR